MKKYRITYHIFDSFGELVKIAIDKPNKELYDYVVVKEVVFDINDCEEALI